MHPGGAQPAPSPVCLLSTAFAGFSFTCFRSEAAKGQGRGCETALSLTRLKGSEGLHAGNHRPRIYPNSLILASLAPGVIGTLSPRLLCRRNSCVTSCLCVRARLCLCLLLTQGRRLCWFSSSWFQDVKNVQSNMCTC